MKKSWRLLCFCLTGFCWMILWGAEHCGAGERIAPTLNHGRKWRIGYYEGGAWQDYRESLKAVVEGLMEIGWIEIKELPQVSISDQQATYPFWKWLATAINSRYVEFVDDAFWTSGWKEDARILSREDCIRRLNAGHVDLIFAMGTWAGKDIATSRHSVPTMVMSTTDPIQSGIIKSAEDSGLDHVHARCDPTRRQRQIRLFHDIIAFKRLGVVYDDQDPDGRVLSHLNELEEIGRERGFAVLPCAARDPHHSMQAVLDAYRACVRQLAPDVDAFYLSDHRGTEADYLPETIQPLLNYKVPIWSARGSKLVARGALLSVARENFSFIAPFYARVVARIFNGDKPRQIPQVFKDRMRLAINLETARRIGFTIPTNVRKAADIVYERIETPQADL